MEKWTSNTTPFNIFDSINKFVSLESCPKFWGKVLLNRLYERFKNLKDVRFLIDSRIGSEIELFQKESINRFLNCPSSLFKWPKIWTLLNFKNSRLYERHPNKLFRILDISWLQWLDDNMISLKLQRLPNDLRNFPPSSLYDRSILMIDVKFPTALEIEPYNLLEPRLRDSRWIKIDNQ